MHHPDDFDDDRLDAPPASHFTPGRDAEACFLDEHVTALRDRFAMAALTGIAASGEAASIPTKDIPSVLSKAAYEIADAMMKARSL